MQAGPGKQCDPASWSLPIRPPAGTWSPTETDAATGSYVVRVEP